MPELLLPSIAPATSGSAPATVGAGTTLPSVIISGVGAGAALALPVVTLTAGFNSTTSMFIDIFTRIASNLNCPPTRRYPLEGQRGPGAWELL